MPNVLAYDGTPGTRFEYGAGLHFLSCKSGVVSWSFHPNNPESCLSFACWMRTYYNNLEMESAMRITAELLK